MWEHREAVGPWWPDEWGEAPGWVGDVTGEVITASTDPSDRWRGVGASRRGRLHAHRGESREDAMQLVDAGPLLIAAVADGAGSRSLSRIGAAMACRAAVESLRDRALELPDDAAIGDALRRALLSAESALTTLAATHDLDARELRTTLLLGVIAHTAQGTRLGAAQIGDGVIAVEHTTGEVRLFMPGDGGEFAGEVTHFLPDDGAAERAAHRTLVTAADDLRSVLLCTDGVDDCFYPIANMGPPLLDQLRRGVERPLEGFVQRPMPSILGDAAPHAALAEWLTFEKRGENDDRTLVLLWRDVA